MICLRVALSALFALVSFSVLAADYPAPKQGDWIAKDFKFHGGETMPELRLHYTTVGEPGGQPVLVLHGSGGSAASMLTATFAGELFGPGQPLDASQYYIIIPDGIGHGKSSKPSDGMKTAFPKYDYEDMVEAQYRLIKEGLGYQASAARDRQLDGRQADLDLGREVSVLYGRAGSDGLAADRNGRPQLDAAAGNAGHHTQRP
jgi:homoserine O-acetyltransferase